MLLDANDLEMLPTESAKSPHTHHKYYRVTRLVANLGWVDFDLGCSTILLGQ